jgi:thioredoxin reductase (NADPH)
VELYRVGDDLVRGSDLGFTASGNFMLTIDEVSAVPLFSTLPTVNLERLARTSADIRLNYGEFAVHEGGEPALFAVLSGKFEVIKTVDGVERTLGWRVPGAIFGEVPIALGTPFPGGYRAAEPSRVMRVDLQEYYTIAAASKDVSMKLSALARERMGELQSIAAEPHRPRVTLVGHRWDTATDSLRRFLARNQISFRWMTPDAPELLTHWPGTCPTGDEGPVVRLADGQVLVAPGTRDLANRLGLQTAARSGQYDVAIVGGGPAGLAAAVYGASEGLRLAPRRLAPRISAAPASVPLFRRYLTASTLARLLWCLRRYQSSLLLEQVEADRRVEIARRA